MTVFVTGVTAYGGTSLLPSPDCLQAVVSAAEAGYEAVKSEHVASHR